MTSDTHHYPGPLISPSSRRKPGSSGFNALDSGLCRDDDKRFDRGQTDRRHAGVKPLCRLATVLVVSTGMLLMAAQAPAMDSGEFQAPSLEHYVLQGKSEGDGDGDGVNETHIERFRDLDGDSIFNMTTHGTLWAWSLSTWGADPGDLDRNYVIRDSDCNGTFDERYRIDEEFHVPPCLK